MESRLEFHQRLKVLGRRHRRALIPKIAFVVAIVVLELAIVWVARSSFGPQMGWLSSSLFFSGVLLFAIYQSMAETVHHARLRGVDLKASLRWFATAVTLIVFGTVYARNDSLVSGSLFLVALLGFRILKSIWDLSSAIESSKVTPVPNLLASGGGLVATIGVWAAVELNWLPPETIVIFGVICVLMLMPLTRHRGIKQVLQWPPWEDIAKIAHSLSGYAPMLLLIALMDSSTKAGRWSLVVATIGCYIILKLYRALGALLEDRTDECVGRQDWVALGQALKYLVMLSLGTVLPMVVAIGLATKWGVIPSLAVALFLSAFAAHQLVQVIAHGFRIDTLIRPLSIYLRWGVVPIALLMWERPEDVFQILAVGEAVLLIMNLASLLSSSPRVLLEDQFYSRIWGESGVVSSGARSCIPLRDFFSVFQIMRPVLAGKGLGNWFAIVEGEGALEAVTKCLPHLRHSDLLIRMNGEKCLLWLPTCLRRDDVRSVGQKIEQIVGKQVWVSPLKAAQIFGDTIKVDSSGLEVLAKDRLKVLDWFRQHPLLAKTRAVVWIFGHQGFWMNQNGQRASVLQELRLRRHSKNVLSFRGLNEVSSSFDHALNQQVLAYAPLGQAWVLVTVPSGESDIVEKLILGLHRQIRRAVFAECHQDLRRQLPPVVFQRLQPLIESLAARIGCTTKVIEDDKVRLPEDNSWVMAANVGAGRIRVLQWFDIVATKAA